MEKRWKVLARRTRQNRKEFITTLENEFNVKIPSFARKWVCENFMDWSGIHKLNSTKRIGIRHSGYNKSISWLINNGIIKRFKTYPLNGYGESFEFTRKLFDYREMVDLDKILKKAEKDLREILDG